MRTMDGRFGVARGKGSGLLGSLDDLALRAALLALALPLGVLLIRFALGFRPGDTVAHGDITGPLLAITLATYILVPMLALAAAAGATGVMLGAAMAQRLTFWRLWRGAFLLVVAAWAVAGAYIYDAVVIPRIT
jgi:hypothetical protein